MVRLLSILLAIGGGCGALLVGTHAFTEEGITANRQARARMLLEELAGAALPEHMDLSQATFGACDDRMFQRLTVPGYAGPIYLTVMWRADDASLALRVTGHRETPGIGDFIDHQRDAWLPALDGSTRLEFEALDNVSGATITSNAMRRAAAQAYGSVEAYCDA